MNKDPERLTRRKFLLAAGAAAGGLLAAGCGENTEDPFALTKPPIKGSFQLGEEHYVTTACQQCPAGCSINARVVEGRLVKLDGNPTCPINEGGIGPRGGSGAQVLYDPDRIQQPLLRQGPRGSANFKPVSWDVALTALSDRLQGLRAKNESHRTAIMVGHERGLMLELWQRFARCYGTPNLFDGFSHSYGAIAQAFELVTGIREVPAFDWTTTQYILSIDSGLFESSCQSIYFARAQALLRRGHTNLRAKIVHAGQAMTRTGINADEVVRIVPGTDAAFVLGLCHIIVKENLHDKDYLAAHCLGFETWTDAAGKSHPGFQDALAQYTPEFVAKECGIAEKHLPRIAREMAQSRPCFAITGPQATLAANGLNTAWAVQVLNALLGMIHVPGGVLAQLPPPLMDWPHFEPDEVAQAGLNQPRIDGVGTTAFPLAHSAIEAVPEAIMAAKPYAIDTLLLYFSNPAWSKINPKRWQAALAKVPFIVSFSPFMDETVTDFADLVLPDMTYLERWEDSASAPSAGFPIFGTRQPVVRPQFETKATGDVVIELAKKVGAPLEKAFPWKDFRDALLRRIFGLFRARTGNIVDSNGAKFLEKLFETGYWTKEGYPFDDWKAGIATPSGKIELYATALAKTLTDRAAAQNVPVEKLLADLHLPKDIDQACVPHYVPNTWQGNPQDYPLALIPFKPNTYATGSGANLPFLQELPLYKGRKMWTTEAQIHPDTANEYGIVDGDTVLLESSAGSISLPIYLTAGVTPGTVRVPRGGGHTAFGRFAQSRGANVMSLLSPEPLSPLTGVSPVIATRVRIRKVTP
ncbi:MAG: molybdopterin-containing oxidoreductase family protein [Planctomycetota bacterium]